MFKPKSGFSGFSVDDTDKALKFYTDVLGLKVENGEMGLTLHIPHSEAKVFVYSKGDKHEPASFTVFNLVVDDIDEAVDELVKRGVKFERYSGFPFDQDEKGIARGIAAKMGPDIAWFQDPAGNVFSVIQNG